jgi:MacB-like periplasmic core domain
MALVVTDGARPLLGIPPMLGRWFNHSDDSPGSPDTVMLTYGYWRQKFGRDRSVVGRTLTVDGKVREVIGVFPQKFNFLDDEPPVILPFGFDRAKLHLGNFSYQGLARLKPGATVAQAEADITELLRASPERSEGSAARILRSGSVLRQPQSGCTLAPMSRLGRPFLSDRYLLLDSRQPSALSRKLWLAC